MLRLVALAAVALVGLSLSAQALAQSRPSVRVAALPSDVEVGQVFIVKLTAMISGADRLPEKPELSLPPGFTLRGGPHIMPQTQVSITGAGVQQSAGIEASWQVEARAAGKKTIGPAAVTWQGKRFETGRVEVNVHPPGTLPRRQDPFDLFDIFGMPKMPGLPDLTQPEEPSLPPADPALAMTAAPDRGVFLRATVDKTDIVLGEQVTLQVYEYVQGGTPRQVEAHEPAASDFLQRPLLAPDDEPGTRYAEVGSETWRVRLIRKVALFPLKTGVLTIGPMEVSYQGPSLRSMTVRRSSPLRIRVHDAPDAGRPMGYRAGDVGQFSLSAEVSPTTVVQGGSVAVTIKLQGVGNLPMSVVVPRRKEVDWLDPSTREHFDVTSDDRVEGERVFTYVVRMLEPGKIELGTVELPFYDPWRRTYERATATLGAVTVTPSSAPVASDAELPDRFAAVAGVRSEMTAAPTAARALSDRPWFWLSLVVGPVGVLLLGAGASVGRRAKARLDSWRASPNRHTSQALRQAREALAAGAMRDAVAAAERALHIGLEAASGLKSRGVLRDQLASELVQRGVAASMAQRAVGLLGRCEDLRFDPATSEADAGKLVSDISGALDDLRKSGDRGGAGS